MTELTSLPSSLSEWLLYLEAKSPSHVWQLGLERVANVAEKLNLARFSCPVITVTGTNGKGSTVAFLEAIYQAAGYRVGAYASPHLLEFNERIRINKQPISDDDLCQAFAAIAKGSSDVPLTYFEFITLAALWLFKGAQLEVILLEVGLGGRLDAVNVIDADLAIVTTIGIDHADWLGNTREAIAQEKAGIFRAGKIAICGDPLPPENLASIAQALGSTFYQFNKDFHAQNKTANTWQWQSHKTILSHLPKTYLVQHNAATALMAIQVLQPRLAVKTPAIHEGLAKAYLPGRLQSVGQLILDVAHNPHAAQWLAQALSEKPCKGKTYAVVAMLADKDIAGTLRALEPQIAAWHVSNLSATRAAPAALLASTIAQFSAKPCYDYVSISAALKAALTVSHAEDRILVFGSFYTVQAALQFCMESDYG